MSKRVHLAVGHGVKPDGRFDPGAASTDGKFTEQSAGDIVVRAVANRLRGAGVHVDDEAFSNDPAFEGTVRAINKADPSYDLAVTIHHDWNRAPEGGFGFWYPGSGTGQRAADKILAAYKAAGLKTRDEWHKARGGLYYLRKTNCPAVLWECGRIGEYTVKELATVAEAVLRGIADHLGVTLVEEGDDAPAPSTAETAEDALGEIKDHLGIKVGQVWDVADYRAISDRVRELT